MDRPGNRPARALAVLRIGVGVLFLIFGEYKVFERQFAFGGGFQFWINQFLAGGAYPFMAPILKSVVLPAAKPFALLVGYGEFAIGLSLVSGLLVRTASGFGAVYMLALLFSSNYPGPGVAFWRYFGASLSHLPLAMCFAVFLLAGPAEELSLWYWWGSRRRR